MPNIIVALFPVVGVILALVIVGFIAAKLYTRASQERAFIRTGLGGQKVVMTGGALVLPVFHEVIWVNRNTLRLSVDRGGHQSLITQDRLRVDVSAEFYVRVAKTTEALAIAAQTLGGRTTQPEQLKALIEGKFVDSLRSAAASMTMEQLHEMRSEFVQNVKTAVSKDLAENGLELESVSLTSLNQTKREFFDPTNAFDAEGLLKLTREIETRNKARNDIEQDTAVQIEQKNLTATKQQLELKLSRETAVLNTDRDIARAAAAQEADVASAQADARRQSEEATLLANQQISERRIATETAVQLKNQDQNITVANRSRDEAAAEAAASIARADAVKAEEAVETTRQVATAERAKAVTLVRAEEAARQEATRITVAAEAERDAAGNLAAAERSKAEGERDAAKLRAEGTIAEGNAVATALREKNEAQNLLNPELVAQQLKLALLQALPGIIEQSVKPLENIDSIRIAEVGGLHGGNGGNGTGTGTAGSANAGGLGSEVVNAALRYRTSQPVVDGLLAEVGLASGGNLDKLVASAAGLAGVSTLQNLAAGGGESASASADVVLTD